MRHKVNQLGLQMLYDQLNTGEQALLRASQLWPAPLPARALVPLAQHHGLDIVPAGARLSGMSLWQDHRPPWASESTWCLNQLTRSVLPSLDETAQHDIARLILPALPDCWPGPKLTDTQQHTLLWLALAAQDSDLIRQHAVPVLDHLNAISDYRTGNPLAACTLAAVQQQAIQMPFSYWRVAAELLQRHPDTIEQARTCFASGAQQLQTATMDRRHKSHFQVRYAELLVQDGQIDQAEDQIQQALQCLQADGHQHEMAVAQGVLARIRTDQGEVAAALALHEERLDVFTALGDQRARAMTLGDIARIRTNQGEVTAQAIPCLRESFQLFQQMGRVDGLSVVGQVLGYILLQGDSSEAGVQVLRISQQAYRKLGETVAAAQIRTWLDDHSVAV